MKFMLTFCLLILIGVWFYSRSLWIGVRIFLVAMVSFLFVCDQVVTAYRYNVLAEGRCELKIFEQPKNVRGYISSGGAGVSEKYLLQHDYDWIEGGVDDNNPVRVRHRVEKISNNEVRVLKEVRPKSRYLLGGDVQEFHVLGHLVAIDRQYVRDLEAHKVIAEIEDVQVGGGKFFLGRGVYELLENNRCFSRMRENGRIMDNLADLW